MPAIRPPTARELRIALNAADTISRGALCRLSLDLESWAEAGEDVALERLGARLGVPAEPLRRALALRPSAAEIAGRELARADAHGDRLLDLEDADYPAALRDLALPPPVLYCRGEIPQGPAVAIVGSRRMSPYGREVTELFAGRLAAAGVTIVSGFALGVDAVAHRAAVARPEGRSVAVLGCGIDVDYPRGNGDLAGKLASQGAVISELAFGAPPRRWHFPVRNRVIAALADATLVIQARPRSGSLITAHHALELGREVFAVPGSIFDELALGTNGLIADGAHVAATPEDLLERLAVKQKALFPRPALASPAATSLPEGLPGEVLGTLSAGAPRTAEDLAAAIDKPVDRVLAALLELELSGWIERQPGPVYLRLSASPL